MTTDTEHLREAGLRTLDAEIAHPEHVYRHYPDRTPLPPGYVVELVGDHWCWVRLSDDLESCIHWNHWACWRGAWSHYRALFAALEAQERGG